MAEMSIEEKLLVMRFRENLKDVLYNENWKSDHYLIRWIRARELNLEKAEIMIRDSIKWRQENKVDSLLEQTSPEFFTSNYPYDIDLEDKEGRPVFVIPIGKWDVRKAVDAGRTDEFIQYTNKMFESIVKKIEESKSSNPNWPHTQLSIIADWDGFSFAQLVNIKAVQGLLQMASTYEAHYPEILHRAVFFNCTYAFTIFFKLLKQILAPRTMGKIVTCGCNRSEWIPVILEDIDEQQLPEHYGEIIFERYYNAEFESSCSQCVYNANC